MDVLTPFINGRKAVKYPWYSNMYILWDKLMPGCNSIEIQGERSERRLAQSTLTGREDRKTFFTLPR